MKSPRTKKMNECTCCDIRAVLRIHNGNCPIYIQKENKRGRELFMKTGTGHYLSLPNKKK